jgi:hypothetical protein
MVQVKFKIFFIENRYDDGEWGIRNTPLERFLAGASPPPTFSHAILLCYHICSHHRANQRPASASNNNMHRFPLKLILLLYYSYDANAFLTPHRHFTRTPMQRTISASPHFAKRYGPPESTPGQSNNPSQSTQDERGSVKLQFTKLLNEVMSSPSEEIPSLLTKNIDTILTTMQLDLIEEVIQDDLNSHPPDKRVEGWREERLEELSEVVDLIVTFVESFVEEAKSMEDLYKKLLGRIFKIIAKKENNQLEKDSDASVFSIGTSADMEATLDQVLAEESEAFTPGFLRHLEGECSRIANLPTISPESSKMLQILRVIQARVLEELGKVSVGHLACINIV